jgi:LemA protein
MKAFLIFVGVMVLSIVLLVFYGISVKNGLIDREETVQQKFSEIDNQLKRRSDLIPNLVNVVKGYAKHEKELFSEVANARSRLLGAGSVSEKAAASSELGSALGRLLAISENYPQLKADQSFIRLQDELAGTENRITVARKRYNEAVKDFRSKVKRFPGSIFKDSFDIDKMAYFEVEDRAAKQNAPKVEF